MAKKISNIPESYPGGSSGRHLLGKEDKMQKVLYWEGNQRKNRSRQGVADHYYL